MRGAKLPPVFSCAELAAALGWKQSRVRRLVRRLGLYEPGPREGRKKILITYSELMTHCPEVFHSLAAAGLIELSGADASSGEGACGGTGGSAA